MDFKLDAFPVDDTKNGIRSTEKIKILVCYIMNTVKAPLSRSLIQSVLYDNGIANYFEISQAVDDLLGVNAIEASGSENGEALFEINEKGIKIAEELEKELSVYIKNKAVKAAMLTLLYEKRKKENHVEITKLSDKRYRLDITMYSGMEKDDELLKVSVYVTDAVQAEAMKNSFINNPVTLYEKVIEGLTSNPDFKE